MTREQIITITIYVLLFLLLLICFRLFKKESFVTMPGELDVGVCLATCAEDSQCQVALYNETAKKCAVARDFALPDDGEIAFRKLDLKKTPKTFIRSDNEDRINTTESGVDGQGLPIDWTLDSNIEHKLTKEENENLLNQRAKEYELDDQEMGFSDLDVVYHPQGNEGTRNESNRSRTTKERMVNISAHDVSYVPYSSVSDYDVVERNLNERSAKTIKNITLPDYLQLCKKNRCNKAIYNPDSNICYLKR